MSGLKYFSAALAANAGGDVAHDHQLFLTAIVVVDSLLDDFPRNTCNPRNDS
jgi:hypothetical protein